MFLISFPSSSVSGFEQLFPLSGFAQACQLRGTHHFGIRYASHAVERRAESHRAAPEARVRHRSSCAIVGRPPGVTAGCPVPVRGDQRQRRDTSCPGTSCASLPYFSSSAASIVSLPRALSLAPDCLFFSFLVAQFIFASPLRPAACRNRRRPLPPTTTTTPHQTAIILTGYSSCFSLFNCLHLFPRIKAWAHQIIQSFVLSTNVTHARRKSAMRSRSSRAVCSFFNSGRYRIYRASSTGQSDSLSYASISVQPSHGVCPTRYSCRGSSAAFA